MRTLCIDIGGTGTKAMVVDDHGKPLGERLRVPTPRPAVPPALMEVIVALATGLEFDRVSIGFPGVVKQGVVETAPNLDEGWAGFDLAGQVGAKLGKPARAANDAGVQGLGVIEGKGTEIVVTLGTGMGFGLYLDGRYVPNIELAHHPLRKDKTYEERISDAERDDIGNDRWKKRVHQAIDQIRSTFNPRVIYIGGGNARHLTAGEFGEDVHVVDNVAGLLGGVRLWD